MPVVNQSKFDSNDNSFEIFAGEERNVKRYLSFLTKIESKYTKSGMYKAMSDAEYKQFEMLKKAAYRG